MIKGGNLVGFIWKTCNEITELQVYSMEKMRNGTIYHHEQTFTVGDKTSIKRWKEVTTGNGYITELLTEKEKTMRITVGIIQTRPLSNIYEIEGNHAKIVCREHTLETDTISEYTPCGLTINTTFHNPWGF